MKDHYYIENTKSKFTNVEARLLKNNFKLTSYGDISDNIGEAHFSKPGIMYRLTYKWIPNPNGRGYISGQMISIEDVTSCYSEILGKKTGY